MKEKKNNHPHHPSIPQHNRGIPGITLMTKEEHEEAHKPMCHGNNWHEPMRLGDKCCNNPKHYTPKGKKEFYLHLSNGDTDNKPDYKESVLGDIDFELDVGQDWMLITRRPLSTKKYLALLDLLKNKVK